MKLRCQNLPALMRTIAQLEETSGADFSASTRRSLEKYVRELADPSRGRGRCRHQPLFQDRANTASSSTSSTPRLLVWDGTPHIVVMAEYRWCSMRAPKSLGRNRTEPVSLAHRSRCAAAAAVGGENCSGGGNSGTGCSACVTVKAVMRFPQYRISVADRGLQSLVSHRLRYLMSRGQFPGDVWYYAHFPCRAQHNHTLATPAAANGSDTRRFLVEENDSGLVTLDSQGRQVAIEAASAARTSSSSSSSLMRNLDMVECVVRSETSFLALLHRLEQRLLRGRVQQQPPSPQAGVADQLRLPAPIHWHSVPPATQRGPAAAAAATTEDSCHLMKTDLDEDSDGLLTEMEGNDNSNLSSTCYGNSYHTEDAGDEDNSPDNFPSTSTGRGASAWKSRRGRPLKDPLMPRMVRLTAAEMRLTVVDHRESAAAATIACTRQQAVSMADRLEAAEARIGRLESRMTRLISLIGCDPTA